MMECLSKSKLRIWGDILIHLGVFIQVIYSFRLLFQASLDLGEVELNGSNSVISSTKQTDDGNLRLSDAIS